MQNTDLGRGSFLDGSVFGRAKPDYSTSYMKRMVPRIRVQAVFLFYALLCGFVIIPPGAVFAHGDEAPAETLYSQTQIGLPDSRQGHAHGGMVGDQSGNFDVSISSSGPYQAGIPQALRFTITKKATGEQVKEFVQTQTKYLHLIIVSSDLAEFYHEHPDLESDGTFLLKDFAFKREVPYTLYFDLSPSGSGDDILLRRDIGVGQNVYIAPFLKSTQFPVASQGLQVRLFLDPGEPKTIGNTFFTFTLSDAANGAPVSDLEAYLGVPAHLVMISQKSFDYIHMHPSGNFPTDPVKLDALRFGPNIQFQTTFPEEGFYKGWLQVLRGGNIVVLAFVISVEKGTGLTRDQIATNVHFVQAREENRSIVKFALITLFMCGMILLFYPKRSSISSLPPSSLPVVASPASPQASATSPVQPASDSKQNQPPQQPNNT